MKTIQNNHMETGTPGLLLLSISAILDLMHIMDRADITFILGTISVSLAIIYYVIQIVKLVRKKK